MIYKRYDFVMIALLTIIQFRDINALTERNKMRLLQNIIQMKSWKNDEIFYGNNLSKQEILANGQCEQLSKFTKNRPLIKIDEMDKISSVMYIALGCKCSDSIKKLLMYNNGNVNQLKDINDITLKAISVLLNFIHIAPNLLSHEPGFLTTALSLNLQLNELIDEDVSQRSSLFKRKILQMINLIELFVISNCSIIDMEMMTLTEDEYLYENSRSHINYILDNVGLSTTYMIEFIPANELPNVYNFNLVNIQLVKNFKPLMDISDELEETIKKLNNIEDILVYMNFINNSIINILYEIILQTLIIFELYSKKGNEDHMQNLFSDWINKDDILLQYQQLYEQSILMKFPSNFNNHIELFTKIIREILVQNNILDLRIIKIQVHQNLDALRKTKHPAKLLTLKYIKGYSFNTYIKRLLSIDELEIFNEILVLFQINPAEYSLPKITLNTIETYSTLICNDLKIIYDDCFYIQSKLKVCKSNQDLKYLQIPSISILYKLKDIFNDHKNDLNNDMKFILKMAIGYLENNMINYPTIKGQLYRILYFIIILIEKFQILYCENPNYRTSCYKLIKTSLEKSTYNFVMRKSDFANEKNTNEESTRLQIQKYIQEFNNLPGTESLKFYWNGELRNINEISNDLTKNNFDFSSFKKYYNIFHQWNLLVMFNAFDDILNFFLKENYSEKNDKTLINFIKLIQTISFPEYILPSINAIGSANTFSSSENTIGILILMQKNIQKYSSVIKLKYDSSKPINYYFESLHAICKILINVYNIKPDMNTVNKPKPQNTIMGRLKSLVIRPQSPK